MPYFAPPTSPIPQDTQNPILQYLRQMMTDISPQSIGTSMMNPIAMPVFATGSSQLAQSIARGVGGSQAEVMARNLGIGGSQMAALQKTGGNIDDIITLIQNPLTKDYGMTLLHELTHAGQAVRGLPSNMVSIGARIANELGAWLPTIQHMPEAAERAVKPLTNYFGDAAAHKLGSRILESLGIKAGTPGREMAQQFINLLKTNPQQLMQKFSEVVNPAYGEHLGIKLSSQQVTQLAELGKKLMGGGGFRMGPEALSTLKGKSLNEIIQAFMQMVK